MTTYWIAKYALSAGIFSVEAEHNAVLDLISYEKNGMRQYAHGLGRNYYDTSAGAKAVAEQMRTAKIASLKKQIAKFEKMKF